MLKELLNIIVTLEVDLSQFYARLKSLARLKESRGVLEFMDTHSYAHSEVIRNEKEKLKEPNLNSNLILDFHRNLKQKVFDEIVSNNDIEDIMNKLANSEESLGKLYKSIAQNVLNISDYYKEVYELINRIGDEEFDHRDLLLNELKNIKK